MKLLIEGVSDFEVLTEGAEGAPKKYSIRGVFMMAEQKNRNGRVYPLHILEREANRYVANYVQERRAYGELDHPPTPTVNLKNVSHIITELKRSGNDFIGTAKIIDETDAGRTARGLLAAGCQLGVSSRGVGDLDRSGDIATVKENYHLITPADLVADPSAPKAFVQSITESADWVYMDGKGWVVRFVEEAKKHIHKTPKRRLGEAEVRIFENFMQKLKSQIL